MAIKHYVESQQALMNVSENYINVNYTGSTANKTEPVYSNVPKEVSDTTQTRTVVSMYACYSLSLSCSYSSDVELLCAKRRVAGINVLSSYFVYVDSQQTHHCA